MIKQRSTRTALMIAALGVVFGDIGTSPLYTMQSIFSLDDGIITPTLPNIYGIVSTIFWSLTVIVTFKYVILLMRADNGREGGILALMALVERSFTKEETSDLHAVVPSSEAGNAAPDGIAPPVASPKKHRTIVGSSLVIVLGVVAAGLFYGDSIITPAISVMSAIEGIQVINPSLQSLVVPLGVTILVALFSLQRLGTERVGKAFGPIIFLWFFLLAILGLGQIAQHPQVLWALSPHYAFSFIFGQPAIAFVAFGSIVLAVTGAEALYADMGHFGRGPIAKAWLSIVFPALILNYLGQAALLAHHPEATTSPFFLMAPRWAQFPLVLMATAATLFASQAVITGAFSVSKQAQNLHLLPRLRIRQTSSLEAGQIYVPLVNWLLFIGVITLLLIFQTSERLATAYGLAVTGTFLMSTCLFTLYAYRVLRWALWKIILIAILFFAFETSFFLANAMKLFHGGWIPLTIGIIMVTIMLSWRRGLQMLFDRRIQLTETWDEFFARITTTPLAVIPGTAIYLHMNPATPPQALETNLRFNSMIHHQIIVLRVVTSSWPRVPEKNRIEVTNEYRAPNILCVQVTYGFMEEPDLRNIVDQLRTAGIEIEDKPFYFTSQMTLVDKDGWTLLKWWKRVFFYLYHHQARPVQYFNLPPKRTVAFESRLLI